MAKDTDGLLLSASLDINKTANNIKKEDINKINAILANDDSARVKIVGGLNLSKTQSLIQSQIATISKNLKLNIGSIDTSGFNTQNITDGLNNIQTQTNQVANSLTNLADKFKRPIKPVLNTDGLIDADKTIEKVQKKFSELGTVSVRGIYGDKLGDDQLEKMIVNIESAQGEVRTLTFQIGELSNAQKKLGEGDLFHLTKGTSDNSGIEKLIISTQKAQDKIKALRTSLTADLEAIRTAWNDTNSNKSVKSTENIESLNAQYSKAEEAIISLGNADDTTFASMAVNADVQIQKLSQMVTQYHNAEKAEKSLQNQVKNYGDKIDSNILKLNNVQNQSTFLKNSSNPQVVEAKKQIADLITEYQTLKNTLQGDLTPDGIQNAITRFDELDKQFKQVTTSANTLKTSISASDTMSKQAQQTELLSSKIKKLIAEINTYKNANSRVMSSNKLTSNGNTFAQELENMLLQLSHCASTEDFQKIAANFRGIKAEAKQLGIEGGTVFTTLWEKLKKFSSWMSMTSVVSSVVMDIRNAIVELKEIDTILTEISKTSDLTTEALAKLGKTSFDSASKYGKKASDYLVGVQEMYRAGFQNAPEMSELSILAQAAGDLSSDAANDYLIATDAAYSFKGSIEKLNAVLDSQNYITNNAAVAMQDMADATSEAASVAAQYGIDIDELSALIAVAVSKTRESGSEVGNALKSIFINLQDTTSKPIQDAFASVDISMTKLVNGSEKLKTPIELIKELSKAFTSLEEGDTRRANILSDIGGRLYHNVQKCA